MVAVPTGCPPVDPTGARSGRDTGRCVLSMPAAVAAQGFHYLMQAWRLADFGNRAELWIAGGSELDMAKEIAAQPNIRYLGPLSSDAVADVYRKLT